jgi:molybdate transport system regulatory protein
MPGTETPQSVKLNYKIWLSTPDDRGIMGDGKWQILKAIETHGSLKAATKALGITYRRTWGDLKVIEETLGFSLLEKTRGGKEGGQSQLTPEGSKLVEAFDDLHAKADAYMEQLFDEFQLKIQGALNG